jgi:Ca2+/Na+ antiporter
MVKGKNTYQHTPKNAIRFITLFGIITLIFSIVMLKLNIIQDISLLLFPIILTLVLICILLSNFHSIEIINDKIRFIYYGSKIVEYSVYDLHYIKIRHKVLSFKFADGTVIKKPDRSDGKYKIKKLILQINIERRKKGFSPTRFLTK